MTSNEPPTAAEARQIATYFGLVADTLDWQIDAWQALSAKLVALGKPPSSLTLGDVQTAITAVLSDANGGER